MPSVLLTGASKGLGLAALRLLLTSPSLNGAKPTCITTISRSVTPELNALQKEFADRLEVVQGDVQDREVSVRAVGQAVERFGGLDSVVLNAGVLDPLGRLSDVDVEAVKAHFDINFFSLLSTIQVALPHLRLSKGSIVLVSSGAATTGYTAWGPYCAGKAAMNSLARTLAAEEEEVKTIAVRPGVVDTSMQTLIRSKGRTHMSASDHGKFTQLHSSGSLLNPADPGYALAALAVKGPPEGSSGSFVTWNAPELADFQRPDAEK